VVDRKESAGHAVSDPTKEEKNFREEPGLRIDRQAYKPINAKGVVISPWGPRERGSLVPNFRPTTSEELRRKKTMSASERRKKK